MGPATTSKEQVHSGGLLSRRLPNPMGLTATSEELEFNEWFFSPGTPPRMDRLVVRRSIPRAEGGRENCWVSPTTGEVVELPNDWPPFGWEADGSPIPDERNEEAVGQWFG